ncbi:glycosyltransferase family 4 protein [bacterium 1XD42-54]|nr:glycosyltransferase family 4 protein [bacterium 1XD42-54]
MKICFVGPASSVHLVKWCNWFAGRGHTVHVISFTKGEIPTADVHLIDTGVDPQGRALAKLKYMLTGKQMKRLIQEIRPDIINVHFATSYGIAMALSGIEGYILSVWGSDVYDFPKKSPLHKALLRFSLRKAAYLFSTSRAMADEAGRYTDKKFEITPFGVDMKLFHPDKRTGGEAERLSVLKKEDFVVGTVKALSDKYGISYLLKAVAEVRKHTVIPIKLRIAGKGVQEEEYRQLAKTLGIDDITTWLGFISQDEAAEEWANMDVAIIPSTLDSESFGVSAVEAQACGTAVIISDVPGLMEATIPGKTAVVVKRKDVQGMAGAIIALYNNVEKRRAMGKSGRQFVRERFELNDCFLSIEQFYNRFKEKA